MVISLILSSREIDVGSGIYTCNPFDSSTFSNWDTRVGDNLSICLLIKVVGFTFGAERPVAYRDRYSMMVFLWLSQLGKL